MSQDGTNSPKLAQKTTREHMQRAQALIQKQKLEIQGDPSTNLCTHRPSSQNVYRLHDQNVEHQFLIVFVILDLDDDTSDL